MASFMRPRQSARVLSNGDLLLAAMGYDVTRAKGGHPANASRPFPLEDQIYQALTSWSVFCGDMAAWYAASFADDPIVLIGSPTMEMCARYHIPTRRSFVVRTLGRIMEGVGPQRFVGIVDCENDPLIDQKLSEQANHWALEFAKHDQLPGFFEALGQFTDA